MCVYVCVYVYVRVCVWIKVMHFVLFLTTHFLHQVRFLDNICTQLAGPPPLNQGRTSETIINPTAVYIRTKAYAEY